MTMHQLVSSEAKNGRLVLQARCGATMAGRTNESLPAELTAWSSGVTCRECQPTVESLVAALPLEVTPMVSEPYHVEGPCT